MRVARICVTAALALFCTVALAADGGRGKEKGRSKPEATSGTLAEAPAGADAKVLAVLKGVDTDKLLKILAANDEVAKQIKELAKKGATVNVSGQYDANRTAMTVTAISEAGVASDKTGRKDKKK